jgi:hypothetical protein
MKLITYGGKYRKNHLMTLQEVVIDLFTSLNTTSFHAIINKTSTIPTKIVYAERAIAI